MQKATSETVSLECQAIGPSGSLYSRSLVCTAAYLNALFEGTVTSPLVPEADKMMLEAVGKGLHQHLEPRHSFEVYSQCGELCVSVSDPNNDKFEVHSWNLLSSSGICMVIPKAPNDRIIIGFISGCLITFPTV
jgi:hypothetical protein